MTAARGEVRRLLHHGSTSLCGGETFGGDLKQAAEGGSIFGFRRRRVARILEDGVVNRKKGLWWRCTAEPYFPAPVTVLWSSQWYGFAPPEAAI